MWTATTVDGVVSAVGTRLALKQRAKLQLERKISVGAWQEAGGDLGGDVDNPDNDLADGSEAGGQNRRRSPAPGGGGSNGGEGLGGLNGALDSIEALRVMDVSTPNTRAVLLERCGALVLR